MPQHQKEHCVKKSYKNPNLPYEFQSTHWIMGKYALHRANQIALAAQL